MLRRDRGGATPRDRSTRWLTPEFPAPRFVVVRFTRRRHCTSTRSQARRAQSAAEVDLEELYYYRVSRPEGYAIQRVYTGDRKLDETITARDGDLVLVPEGYHPVVAAHGYDVYYLNALAGSARSMAASDDPDYAWVRSEWRSKDPRVPLV